MLRGLLAGLVLLSIVFAIVERAPATPARRWTDPSVRTDLVFWFFTPLVTRTFTTLMLAGALVALAALVGLPIHPSDLRTLLTARGPIAHQPRWLQAIEVLVVSDGLGYWMHRLFHGRHLWWFHAVHHASTHVDWLSSVRLHPINEALMRIAQVVPLILLGFDPRVLAASVPVFTIYALLLHANVNWRFGLLGYAIASPAFHRWHHAEAIDKNFAGLFPFWDLLFGTFYLPAHPPTRFGLRHTSWPEGAWAQLWAPFRMNQPRSR
jgi:sterol desaturase/sphingolipid hydroxylase (fatty acid hydroxylase superfamily)